MATYFPMGGQTYTLQSSISSTQTTITLSSFKVPVSGDDITMALMNTSIAYATISPRTSTSEFISFTGITQNADGTATLTGVTRGLNKTYPYTESTDFKLPHAGATQFILSDAPQVFNKYAALVNDNTWTGQQRFPAGGSASAAVVGVTYSAPTQDNEVATKKYIDDIAISGSPDASTTVKGIGKTSVAPASATNPIFVGDNDPRVPTQAENDALAGTSGAPSSSNKYVTNADTSTTAVVGAVYRWNAGGTYPAADGSAITNINQFLTSGAPGTTTTNTTATVLTYAIAGGTLSTNKGIRIRISIQAAMTATNAGATYTIQYGGSTIGSLGYSGSSGTPTVTAISVIDILLMGSGATNTQRATAINNYAIISGSGGATAAPIATTTSLSVDSTASQNLTVSCTSSGASAVGTFLDYFIHKIN